MPKDRTRLPPTERPSKPYAADSPDPEDTKLTSPPSSPPSTSSDKELKPLDSHRIEQRQKQLDIGKNTPGYDRYLEKVPRHKRRLHHPSTPDVHLNISKRQFDGLVRAWRRKLHDYDMQPEEGEESIFDFKPSNPLPEPEPEPERPAPNVSKEPVLDIYQHSTLTDDLMPSALSKQSSGPLFPDDELSQPPMSFGTMRWADMVSDDEISQPLMVA